MTPDQLRALADALPEGVHWSDPITPDMLAEAIRRFCADAQPMAMLESHRRLVERAIQDAERPSGMSTHDGKARIDASVLRRMLAIIDSLPAAPQAEQPIDLDAVAMQQMRQAAAESTWMPAEYSGSDWISDVCRWLRDGPPQAGPKRDPLHGLAPTHRCPACGALWRQCDDASWNLRSALCCGLCDAGRVELVRLLDEPKREPLTYEQLVSACYTYRHDFGLLDPDEQHLVIEEAGRWAKAFGIGGSDAE